MRPPVGGRITRHTPSVCLSVCPMPTVNSKIEGHTMFKNLCLSEQYGARIRLLSELTDNGWKLGSIDGLLKRIHKTNIVWQPGSGTPRSARSNGGVCAQSGGQAKQAPKISRETVIFC